jgi:tetratricopeptide (TPR) repeat protein
MKLTKDTSLFFVLLFLFYSCNEKNTSNVKVKSDTKDVLFYENNEIIDLTARKLFGEGLKEVDNQNYKSAKEKFIEANKIESKNPIILNGIAQAESRLGNTEKSIEMSLNIISIDSNYVETYVNLGQNYMEQRNYLKAKEILTLGLKFTKKTSVYTKSILLINLSIDCNNSNDCENGLKYAIESIKISKDKEFRKFAENIKKESETCLFKKVN